MSACLHLPFGKWVLVYIYPLVNECLFTFTLSGCKNCFPFTILQLRKCSFYCVLDFRPLHCFTICKQVTARGSPDTPLSWPFDLQLSLTKLLGRLCGATLGANPCKRYIEEHCVTEIIPVENYLTKCMYQYWSVIQVVSILTFLGN